MNERGERLEDMLRGKRYWSEFEGWVKDNDRQLCNADQVKAVVNSRLWYEAFLSYYWAIAEKNYRRSTRQARPVDADVLRDIKAALTQRYFEEASAFADACEAVDGGLSLIDLKDHLCLKLGPRAKHDPKVPDVRGLTQVPRLKGKSLEKAVAEEAGRVGRPLTDAERGAIARWPVTAFVAADQEGSAGNEEGGNARDWLDILKEADPAWTNGHISVLEEMISQEESDAFRQIMLDVLQRQATKVRKNYGPVVWEAVIRYAALRAKGENYGQLPQLCADLGVETNVVHNVLYNLSRKLVNAIADNRPDLTHLLGGPARQRALDRIAYRNGHHGN
jgi:hypothetical protein